MSSNVFRTWFRRAAPFCFAGAIACSGRGPVDPPEVHGNAVGGLEEARIRAELRNGTAQIALPIEKKTSGSIKGSLTVRLVDLRETEEKILGQATEFIAQSEPEQLHTISVPGLPADLARAQAAGIAIDWRAELEGGALYGQKSLYAALGALELEIRGPTEIPLDGRGAVRVLVRDPSNLDPVADADVRAVLKSDDGTEAPLFTGKTDAKGELAAELALPAGKTGGTLRIDVGAGENRAWLERAITGVSDERLYLSTDKTIYKPGQSVELRLLALKGRDHTPIAAREVLVEALDGKGNKVFKKRGTTDEYGVLAMPVPTADVVNEGLWTFRAELDGAKIEKKLPVERYLLPKMKVEVELAKAYAELGKPLNGHVLAKYLFGAAVKGQVTIVAKTAEGSVVASSQGALGEDGRVPFSLAIPASIQTANLDDGGASLKLEATVTDTAEQLELGATALPLVRQPLVVRAITERSGLVPGQGGMVYFLVGDPVGRPIAATLEVSENGAKIATLTSDQDGIAEWSTSLGDDARKLTIVAKDGAERTASRELTLSAGVEKIRVTAEKPIAALGESLEFQVSAPAGVSRVFADLYRSGELVGSTAADVTGGAATLSFPADAARRGLLVADVYALGQRGQLHVGSDRVYVDPADGLEITVRSGRETYVPGEDATLAITVKDQAGRPKVAALGVNVVDEASFALGGEPGPTARALFSLGAFEGTERVLGRGPELLTSADPGRERLARILFAANHRRFTPGLAYNSVREELPVVVRTLKERLERDVGKELGELAKELDDGQRTDAVLPDLVLARISGLIDSFGQPVRASLPDPNNRWNLRVTAAGVDERFDTGDEVEADVWFNWLLWANRDDGDVLANAGGPWAEADANWNAGGPPPQAPTATPGEKGGEGPSAPSGTKVRADFRETILAAPAVITDASGEARLSFPLADSITTWRVSAEGSTKDGLLGATRFGFRTFQEFFVDFDVPLDLTRGDELDMPAVVYNYLPDAQSVAVSIEAADWFELMDEPTKTLELGPSEVRQVKFRIRATKVGAQTLTLRATAGGVGDAIVRTARIAPDGDPVEQVVSDKLNGEQAHAIEVPADAIEGSSKVELVVSPGFAGEAVQGTEAIMQEPNGCFEQTTSSAWPNTLVTTYLEETDQMTPEMREKAVAMVTRGYQRLLTFESPTGGFNWWGDSEPGNRILSAIMLWHLKDMEKIIETDDAVRQRTLTWLLGQQRADGSWASGDQLHAGNESLGTSDIRTTAFIAWALAHTGWADAAVGKAKSYIAAAQPGDDDLYANALAANAMAAIDPSAPATARFFATLDRLKEPAGEGRLKWPTEAPSWTGAGGDAAAIETTSLVAYGLLKARAFPDNAAGGLRFLIANKTAVGSWYNTQATMNALRALLAAASPTGTEATGTLEVEVNGEKRATLALTAEDGDVYRAIDLTPYVGAGENDVKVRFTGDGELSYRLARKSYRPRAEKPLGGELQLEVGYDQTDVSVGENVTAHVVAAYTGQGARDQVIVRVGKAPGFVPNVDDLERHVREGRVARYEIHATSVVFYLMGLAAGEHRPLDFRLTPTLATVAEAPVSSIYAYYEPSIRAELAATRFTAR